MNTTVNGFNPNDYPDVPLYNIQAVASATGVPAITLRSWERRYGVPEPKRDIKGYRLYSQRDMAITRWLKERVQQGVGISRAVNMLRVLESGEIVPGQNTNLSFEDLQAQLINAVDSMDENIVHRIVAQALAIGSVEEVALGLIQPALYEIGDRWKTGQLSVTSEHVASSLLRSYLAQLVRLTPPPLRDARIIVGCAPGELHDIGALTLALFLRRRGFHVTYAGASIEEESFIADVDRLTPDIVCLSASLTTSAETLVGMLCRLRNVCSSILGFGGLAYRDHPELIAQTPGTYLGADANIATRQIEEALLERLPV